jgi:hypothetical protein
LHKQRLKKLAERIEALAKKDESLIRRTREISSMRREAALELHAVCSHFVRNLNQLLPHSGLDLDPYDYQPDHYRDDGSNLFQINASGRILQIKFEATAELVSTEEFRVPYILEGAVRCFNQQLLERDLIEEQFLFYTLEKNRHLWRFFDARTYRSGPFNEDYLISLMERLI